MSDAMLFPVGEVQRSELVEPLGGKPRFQRPDRQQVELLPVHLDSLLPSDHRVRAVWAFVERLDLSGVYASIRAVEGGAGRSPIDPRILMALWLYATLEGVGSARALARLCTEHHVYQWICGGVRVNYPTLSDFRTAHVEAMDEWLSQSAAVLLSQGLVDLKRVAQDGMRVRASAGAASFRRERSLRKCLEQAREQVQRLREELHQDPTGPGRREQAAQERAAREREARVQAALRQLPSVQTKKKPEQRAEARVSTTDADARVMKMGDGGFRPAYNAQLATDTESQVIVGVGVTNSGSDLGQMPPMVEQIEERFERVPAEYLVDGGFAKKEDIEQLAARAHPTTVYAPVQKPKQEDRDPHQPRPGDSAAVAAWRVRMGTVEAKAIYQERASTAECVNAQARNRGLRQFLVRGITKVKAVLLWYALAHNVMRAVALGAGWGTTN
jgi:transposase